MSVDELAHALFVEANNNGNRAVSVADFTERAATLLRIVQTNRAADAAKAPPLVLDRALVAIDVEATGKDPNVDRVVEFAAVTLRLDGSRHRFVQRINPGVPMSAEVIAIHGITDADVASCPVFADVAPYIRDLLLDADRTGFNIRSYDDTILRAEFDRCGATYPEGACVVDSFDIYRSHERRDLSAAVKFYLGREHTGAHGALPDAEAALDVMLAQVQRYPDLPRDIAALDIASGGRQPNWATACGKIRWNADGDAVIAFGSKNMGMRLIDADSGLVCWILGRDFTKDVHALCRDVLDGKRPRAPGAPPAPAIERYRRQRRHESEENEDDDDWSESVAPPSTEAAIDRNANDDIPF